MNGPKDHPVPHVEVPDAAAAFHKLEDAAKHMMGAPKREADRQPAKGKTATKPSRE